MIITKTVLGITAVTTIITATSLFAADVTLAPRAADAKVRTVATGAADGDYVHSASALGNAARAKAAGHRISSAGHADPNLLSCAPIGKASCGKNPCDGTMVAPCCKK